MKRNSWIFFLSFFIGIILINLFGNEWISANGMVNRYTLRTLSFQPVSGERYFVYVLLLRMKIVLFVFLLAKTLPKQIVAKGCYSLLGLTLGSLFTISVLTNGVFGCVLAAAALLPHGPFYFFAFYVWERSLGNSGYSVKHRSDANYRLEKKRTWTLAAVVFVLVLFGCLTESYINPFLFQKIINL